MSAFGLYSKYYDLLYAKKSYKAECDYVMDLAGSGNHGLSILELGCGTGGHAEYLAHMGHQVFGLDMSNTMLERAETRRAGLPGDVSGRLRFAQGDVRTWRDGQTYDVVVSLFHVMSYQTSNDDLEAAFETAAAHLPRGGRFVFDYWSGAGVLSIQPSVRVLRVQSDTVHITRIAEPLCNPGANVVTVNYEIQIEEKLGSRETVHESHPMRYLFVPEIEYMSRRWFKPVAHFGWMSKKPASNLDWAGVTVLEKL